MTWDYRQLTKEIKIWHYKGEEMDTQEAILAITLQVGYKIRASSKTFKLVLLTKAWQMQWIAIKKKMKQT